MTLKALFLVRDSSSFEYWNRIVNLICDLAVQKASLREQCCWVIFESVNDLARKSFDVKYAESTLDSLASRRLLRTPEGVAIWLAVKDKFPNARFPNGVWKNDDPLSSKERGPLALVLKEASTASERDGEVQTARGRGVWSSNINFAWGEVLSRLYVADAHTVVAQNTSVKEKRTRTNFKDFWIEVIDREFVSLQTIVLPDLLQMACSLHLAPKNASTGASCFSPRLLAKHQSPFCQKSLPRTL